MAFRELCNEFKKEICVFCKSNDCNICKTAEGVRCCNYIKDKDKFDDYAEKHKKSIIKYKK